ncbi:MAG: DEAD/DEAH box helicase family protein [Spirochaetes bacterium]|nr:DEAD/DEAH box helicase family protein [Spirochaetota bacterium]
MYARVAFPIPVNQTYYYAVPDDMKNLIRKGFRVRVNFNNRLATGFVLDVVDRINEKIHEKIKPILSLLDDSPVFTSSQYDLARWICEYYICSIGEALKVMIPTAVKERSSDKPSFDKRSTIINLTSEQKDVLQGLKKLPPRSCALIWGITGSGKTEVYFKLIESFIKKKSRSSTLSLRSL